MAVVDVIDLTVSPPPSVIAIDDVNEPADAVLNREEYWKERKKRKKHENHRERRREEEGPRDGEDQGHDGSRKHDELLVEDWDHLVEKRKGSRRKRVDARARKRARGSSKDRLFLVDTGGLSLPVPPPGESNPTDSIPVEPAVKPPAVPPVEPPEAGLLLPDNVTVSAHESVLLPGEDRQLSPNSDASGIDFLDDDCAVVSPIPMTQCMSC
jgi:hypothetical protein